MGFVKKYLLITLLFSTCFRLEAEAAKDSVTVYVFLSETCPICQSSTSELRDIYRLNQDLPVKFIAVFPNPSSSEESIARFLSKYRLNFRVDQDTGRILTRQFSAATTPEVIVVNENSSAIIYRGLIDNRYITLGKRRPNVTAHYLQDALKSHFSNTPIPLPITVPIGCFIQNQVKK